MSRDLTRHVDIFLNALIEWIFRRKSFAALLLKSAVVVGIATVSGTAFNLTIPTSMGPLSLGTGNAVAPVWAFGVPVSITLFIWSFIARRTEDRATDRKRVLAIELRGLRDIQGTPLVGAIPNNILGRREQILVDTRQRVEDGFVTDPHVALRRLLELPNSLKSVTDGVDRTDITIVFGGLAPVPLTFLAGVLIDDEGQCEVVDWDRHAKQWRPLLERDDGVRFEIDEIERVSPNAPSVCLAVSMSYAADIGAIREEFAGVPIVEMRLPARGTETHWSGKKQEALARQFLDVAMRLADAGVNEIHLVLAAPSSFVFRLGRLYDKRNLPAICVYQYEKGLSTKYPWGIQMPVCGRTPVVTELKALTRADNR